MFSTSSFSTDPISSFPKRQNVTTEVGATLGMAFGATFDLGSSIDIQASMGMSFGGSFIVRNATSPLIISALPESFELDAIADDFTVSAIADNFTLECLPE